MKKIYNKEQRMFYLVSVDILQGVSVFVMVMGHVTLWWDPSLDSHFPNLSFLTGVLWIIALVVPAGFLFWYGFNVTNSLLRKKDKNEQLASRSRLLKRSAIFFFFALFMEFTTAFLVFPDLLLNYILTWGLFHMFAFSTVSLLVVFEIAWGLEEKLSWHHNKGSQMVFLVILILLFSFFLLFHDYTPNSPMDYYVNLNLTSIFEHAIFEKGQSPIIPFLIFSLSGGLLATYLDLPNLAKESVVKKAPLALVIGFLIFFIGLLFLQIEPYVSPPVLYPASTSNVFISVGTHIFLTTALVILLDLNLVNIKQKVTKVITPIVLLSQITLTIYVIHNIAFFIPSNHPIIQSVVRNEDGALVIGFFYTLFFILIAFLWDKWNFRYSLEWIISKIQ